MSEPVHLSGKTEAIEPAIQGVVVDQPPVRAANTVVNGQPTAALYVCVVGMSNDIIDEIANRVAAKLNPTPPAASEAQDPNLPAESPAAA